MLPCHFAVPLSVACLRRWFAAASGRSLTAPDAAGQHRQSLRAALLWLLLASLVPLVLVAAAFLWMQWSMQRAAAEAGLRQRAQTLALAVERELGVNVAIVETLAAMPQIDARDWAGLHAVATAAIRSRPFSWIVLVDPSGQEVVNTQAPFGTPLPNLLQTYSRQNEVEWQGRRLPSFDARVLEPVQSGRLAVSGLFYGPVAKRPVLSAGIPVRRNGKPGYSLLMGFTPDTLALLLAGERSAGTALTAIIDGNGRIIARSADIAQFLGSPALPPFDVPAALPTAGLGNATSLEGTPRVYAYQRLSLADWTVVVAIPRQEMFAPVYRTFIPWFLATLLVMAVSFYLAQRLRRRLVLPLTALADSVEALRNGQAPPIPATRIREVDTLSHALLEAAQSEAARRAELTRRLASEEQAKATAQRLAENLRESEERFRLLADNMAQLAWMADQNGAIVWYNKRWFDYTGTTGDEMQRAGWPPLLHPGHGQRVTEKLFHCLRTGEVWEDSFLLRSAAGSYRWFLSRALPVCDPEGRVMRWFGTHTDVTAQWEAEAEVRALSADLELRVRERTISLEEKSRQLEIAAAALQINEARLEALHEHTPAMVFMKDLEGRYVLVNRHFAQIFKRQRQEIIGQTSGDLVPPDMAAALQADDRRVLAEGVPLELEEILPDQDGRPCTYLVVKFPVRDADGRIYALCGIATDITERKRSEAAIAELNRRLERRAAELEAVNRELEMFSYSVSHDLRAPLRGIDGFSRILLESHAGQLDEQGRDYLQHVRAASQRMAQLIDDILALSRLSRTEVRREIVDLSVLAQAVAEELQANESRRDVTFVFQEGVSAVGDARLLRVVLENLLGNAWKYTSHHPRARIEFGAERRDGGRTVYFVRDDGAGFDMAYAGKLFGAFQRLHSQADFPGTGVGLTSVQRIIHRHGGEIWAESAVEAGATFCFTLPETPVDD